MSDNNKRPEVNEDEGASTQDLEQVVGGAAFAKFDGVHGGLDSLNTDPILKGGGGLAGLNTDPILRKRGDGGVGRAGVEPLPFP